MPAREVAEPAAAAARSRRSPRRRWTTIAWRAVSVAAVLGLFLLLVGEVTGASDVAADHSHHGDAAAGGGVLGELQTLVATDGLEPALARLRARASAERTVLRDARPHPYIPACYGSAGREIVAASRRRRTAGAGVHRGRCGRARAVPRGGRRRVRTRTICP